MADDAVYKTLLESTKAIPWRIDWATMKFSYIGPQIEPLLGWAPESWQTVDDWASRMHPEDRDRVVGFCVAQSQAGADHEADYRASHADGTYRWIRDVVHVVRDANGNVEALVGFMFDITERKRTEERVMELQRELEDLSFKDGLTGLLNRRRFDALLASAWAAARETQQPLSVIMIDIDWFKEYNDRYGHVRGDECLKRVAAALSSCTSKPRDFLARYGGEEFVLVLPETDATGARRLAERCATAVAAANIPHETAEGGRVTLSLGVGTVVPGAGAPVLAFLDAVDQAMYEAKARGRNTLVVMR